MLPFFSHDTCYGNIKISTNLQDSKTKNLMKAQNFIEKFLNFENVKRFDFMLNRVNKIISL